MTVSNKPEFEAKIIETVYRGACDAAELQRAIRLISNYFESPGALVGEMDQLHPEHGFAFGANSIDEAFFAGYRSWADHDPAPRTYARLPVGRAAITDRMFSDSMRRKSEFLNEFLVPQTIDGSLGAPLLSTGSRVAMIGIFQGVKRRSFDDGDIFRLERLTPHLTRALQIRRLFLKNVARSEALESIIERNDTGMIGLRGEGPPLFVNGAARAIAAGSDGLGLDRSGRLVIADRTAAIRVAAIQADVAQGGAGGLVRISRPSGLRPYVVLVSPLPAGDDLFANSRGGVLFAIHDPAGRKPPTEQRIAELLRISPSAARVLQAILEGLDLKQYADRAGISMNTVRFHLKSAFALTGAKSQAELVRIAMSALSDLGPYFPG